MTDVTFLPLNVQNVASKKSMRLDLLSKLSTLKTSLQRSTYNTFYFFESNQEALNCVDLLPTNLSILDEFSVALTPA